MVFGAPFGSISLLARRFRSSDSLPSSMWQPAQDSPFFRPLAPLCSPLPCTHSNGAAPGWNTWIVLLPTLAQSGAAKAACEPRAMKAPATARETQFFFIVVYPQKSYEVGIVETTS